MTTDQETTAGFEWAVAFLRDHPEAGWSDLQAARPEGIKLWKGMMGRVRRMLAGERGDAPAAEKEVPLSAQPAVTVLSEIRQRLASLEMAVVKIEKRLQFLGA